MKKTVSITSKEMREYHAKNKSKIKAQLEAAPEFEELPFEGKRVGRGFAAFKEYINRQGRPKVSDKKVVVSFRIPGSDAEKLRAMGKGWQTSAAQYLVQGVRNGKINMK